MMRRGLVGVVLCSSILLGSALGAHGTFAAGVDTVSTTQTFHNQTDTFPDANPCTGAPGTVTLTYNGVFHTTTNANGFWGTGTQTGTFAFTPDDPTQPSYTGHFTTWFGDNNNLQNGSETAIFSVHGTGSDGSTLTFHDVAHMSTSASGLTFSFDKPTCG